MSPIRESQSDFINTGNQVKVYSHSVTRLPIPDYKNSLKDIEDEYPLSYIYKHHEGIENLIHFRHQARLYDKMKTTMVSALLTCKNPFPMRDRLQEVIIQRKREAITKRVEQDQCFDHLKSEERQIAVNVLLSYLDMRKLEVELANPIPLDETEEKVLKEESPIQKMQQAVQEIIDSEDTPKAIINFNAVYIPGFVDKNVAESDRKEYDDPTMHSIENLEYPYVLPHTCPRDEKYMKEKYEAIKQVVELHKLLTSTQKDALYKLLCKHEARFSIGGENLGKVNTIKHEINTDPKVLPFREKLRVYSKAIQDIIDKEIDKLIKDGVIVPSKSPYASNLLLVRKPDESSANGIKERVCVDYRRLNKDTIKDSYPLANIQTIFNRIGKSTWFTTMDLLSGFWQIAIKEEHKHKTAFITARGLYEWLVMPFGLCNAPSTFQRLMDEVIKPEYRDFIETYIDDLVTHSHTFEDHLHHIDVQLSLLGKHNLTVKLSKCKFAQNEVKFLGHIISKDSIKMNPESVSSILKWERPKPGVNQVKAIRGFLGMVGWYRKFIPEFSRKAVPLFNLTKKETKWEWTKECEEAFQYLRDAITKYPVLLVPDPNKDYILHTDASDHALGTALMQADSHGNIRPVAYASKVLDKAQRNYSVTDREALAIVWALEHFNTYLEGHKYTAVTDHAALKYLHTAEHKTPRMHRMVLRLQPYELKLHYTKGETHYAADLLSRADDYMEMKEDSATEKTALRPLYDNNYDDSVPKKTTVGSLFDSHYDDNVLNITYALAGRVKKKVNNKEKEYEVKHIVDRRPIKGKADVYEYRVRWAGYDERDDTWEPLYKLKNSKDKINEYHKQLETKLREKSELDSKHSRLQAHEERIKDSTLETFICDKCEEICDNYTSLLVHRYYEHDIAIELPNEENMAIDKVIVKQLQLEDPQFKVIYDMNVSRSEIPYDATKVERQFLSAYTFIVDSDGLLYCIDAPGLRAKSKLRTQLRLCIPQVMRRQLLREVHSGKTGAHPSTTRMYDKLREYAWWPGMLHDVNKYVTHCTVCQQTKWSKIAAMPQPMSLPYAPWSHVSIDHVGPLPLTARGNLHILVAKCRFTKYVEAWAVPDTDAITTVKCLLNGIICRYGIPHVILSDNGSGFISQLNESFMHELGVKHITSSPHHPQSNGDVESVNKTIGASLKQWANESHTNWDLELPWALFAYNTSVHTTIGETPYYLNHGRDARTILDVILNKNPGTQIDRCQYSIELVERLHEIHSRMMEIYQDIQSKRVNNKPVIEFEVGDMVYLHVPNDKVGLARKFMTRFKGPYYIIEKVSSVNYVLNIDNKNTTVHIERLRRVVQDDKMKRWNEEIESATHELGVYNNLRQKLDDLEDRAQYNLAVNRAEVNIEQNYLNQENINQVQN